MRRRTFIILAGGFAGWPLAADAQRDAMPTIGYLSYGRIRPSGLARAAFAKGLEEAGYVEGQSATIEYRFAEGHGDRLPALAADLVSRKVAVITTFGGPFPAFAAKNATATIPIVFVLGSDPVARGLVTSLAQPGGNITGITFLTSELNLKRLELLRELVPQAKTFGLLVVPTFSTSMVPQMEKAAEAMGVRISVVTASTASEIDTAFASLGQLHADGLVVADFPFFSDQREQLVALAARYAIPAIYHLRDFADSGGLIAYSASFVEASRVAGSYVGRVLRGEKPADLPVQRSTIVELVINMNTAKALGLSVPQSLLARADEVIE